ncbi:hypothetical protein VM98_37240, partial [Streptomyces rubellomurinus subsp. indigoferus]
MDARVAGCARAGLRARKASVDRASRGGQVEGIGAERLEGLGATAPVSGTVPLCATATGGLIDTRALDARYLYGNLRGRVGFGPALRALIDTGVSFFVEVSPHPVLT